MDTVKKVQSLTNTYKMIDVALGKNHIAIVLNRPEKRNAFNAEMIAEITDIFLAVSGAANTDLNLRCILLTGAGASFSAGADLQWMQSMVQFSLDENIQDSTALFDMFLAIRNCPVPVVTAVQGHVMGGAAGLVAASDIAVAVEGTQFAFSEVRLGLAPAVISPFVREKIGIAAASRYLLTGEVFTAVDAERVGLISQVCAHADLDRIINNVVKSFYKNGPKAVRVTKQLVQKTYSGMEEAKDFTSQKIAERRVSDEGQEGLKAFFAKASSSWQRPFGD